MKRALILYAGIGGFCQNIDWTGWEVDAVEIDPAIAECYRDRFPTHTIYTKGGVYIPGTHFGLQKVFKYDETMTGDAHQFLLDHGHEYDFIQSSPPCQTHSRLRYSLGVCVKCAPRSDKRIKHVYPDCLLWQEIIFLAMHPQLKSGAVWMVENVNPYYDCMVKFAPQYRIKLDRHFIWTNADQPIFFNPKDAPKPPKFSEKSKNGRIKEMSLARMKEQTGINLSDYPKIKNKRQVLRNMFEPELAAYIWNVIYKKD